MKPIYLPEIDSTQTYITQLLPDQGPHVPIAAYTFNQKKGKGQGNKKWNCKANAGIALTIAVPFPQNKETDWVLVNKHICSGIITYLREQIHPDFFLKWPNDLIINDRKFGGMIMNVVTKNDTAYLVLGLGLNLKQPSQYPEAIGMLEVLNLRKFDPLPFTKKLITFLKNHITRPPLKKTAFIYNQYLWKLDEIVTFQFYNIRTKKSEDPLSKKFMGVDMHGRAFFEMGDKLIGSHSGGASILLPPRKK